MENLSHNMFGVIYKLIQNLYFWFDLLLGFLAHGWTMAHMHTVPQTHFHREILFSTECNWLVAFVFGTKTNV
jgi:hypothetical protein